MNALYFSEVNCSEKK